MSQFLAWLLFSSLVLGVAVAVLAALKLLNAKLALRRQYQLTKLVVLLALLAFALNMVVMLLPVEIPIEIAAPPTIALSAVPPMSENGASKSIGQFGMLVGDVVTAADGQGVNWTKLIFVLWLLGTVVSLGTSVVRYGLFLRHARNLSEASPELTALYCCINSLDGRQGNGTVWVACCSGSPLSFGLLRPVVLLPANDYSPEELRYILRHEGQHIAGQDSLYQTMMLLLTAFYWFHPGAYLLAWLLRQHCELACDESVLYGEPEESRLCYARMLIRAVDNMSCDTKQGWMLGFTHSTGYNEIKERLLMIKNGQVSSIRSPLFYLMLSLLLVTFLLLGTVNAWSLTYPSASTTEHGVQLTLQVDNENPDTPTKPKSTVKEEFTTEAVDKSALVLPVNTTNIVREMGTETLFIVNERTDVCSMTDGVVVDSWDLKVEILCEKPRTTSGWRGNYIYVQAPSGTIYHYVHLGTIGVEVGDTVKTGDILGTTGKSGTARHEQCGVYTHVYDKEADSYIWADIPI